MIKEGFLEHLEETAMERVEIWVHTMTFSL